MILLHFHTLNQNGDLKEDAVKSSNIRIGNPNILFESNSKISGSMSSKRLNSAWKIGKMHHYSSNKSLMSHHMLRKSFIRIFISHCYLYIVKFCWKIHSIKSQEWEKYEKERLTSLSPHNTCIDTKFSILRNIPCQMNPMVSRQSP